MPRQITDFVKGVYAEWSKGNFAARRPISPITSFGPLRGAKVIRIDVILDEADALAAVGIRPQPEGEPA
jgi:hypothetical protein